MMIRLRLAFRMTEQSQLAYARHEVQNLNLGRTRCLGMVSLGLLMFFRLSSAPCETRDRGVDPANLGKGDWIYSITDATNKLGGHVSGVTNEASLMQFYRSEGIRYLVVKAATSDQLFRGCYFGPQFTRAFVDTAHTHGLWIFGYNRSYGSNILGEIAIADFVFSQGADGYVWDAEAEWESSSPWIGPNGPAKAWQLCSTVRSNWPTKFLAHAPFPIISYHPTFPYKEFGYWCDAIMPQIYHSGWTGVVASASGGINWSDANWANWHKSLAHSNSLINGINIAWANAIKPLAPVAEVYGPSSQSLCAGVTAPLNDRDVMEFMDYLSANASCASPGGYRGVSFWRADLHAPAQWAHIKAATIGEVAGVVNNIVLDDRQGSVAGSWTAVRAFDNGLFFGCGSSTDTNSFGTGYLVHSPGTGESFVEFKPTITVPGNYDIFQWHPFRTDASARVPFVIAHHGGSTTVYANQQINPGNWTWLGRFDFSYGTDATIRVMDEIPETNAVAIADAVKLVFVPPERN